MSAGEEPGTVDPAVLLETLFDAVVLVNGDGTIRWANAATRNLFGTDPADAVGRPAVDFVHPDDVEAVLRKLAHGRAHDHGAPLQVRVRHASGAFVLADIAASNQLGKPGIDGFLLSVHPMRPGPRTWSEDRTSSLLVTTLAQLDDAVVVCDASGALIMFNRAMRRLALMGGSDHEPMLWPAELAMIDPISGLRLDPADHPLERARRGEHLYANLLLQRHDGSQRHVQVRARPLVDGAPDAEGRHGAVLTLRDLTRERQQATRIHTLQSSDPATGLANRHALRTHLRRRLRSRHANGPVSAVIAVELDDLRLVRGGYGTQCSLDVLTCVADRLRALLNHGDLLARVGEHTLALAVERPDEDGLLRLARVVVDVAAAEIALPTLTIGLHPIVGIAMSAEPGGGAFSDESGDVLLARAELALIDARQRPDAPVARYEPPLRASAAESLERRAWLRRTLDAGRLTLHFQPIVHGEGGRVIAFESLARAMDDNGALVPPSHFLPVARRSGLLAELDAQVLATSVQTAAQWRELWGPDAPAVSINLSEASLADPATPNRVAGALDAYGLPGEAVWLECSEHAAMQAEHRSWAPLLERGVELVIDDFGTGRSGFGRLRQAPFTMMKIDKSLVAPLPGRARDTATVRVLVELADALGLKVVAEGIEQPAHREALLELGCPWMQGYLFAEAQPAHALMTEYATTV